MRHSMLFTLIIALSSLAACSGQNNAESTNAAADHAASGATGSNDVASGSFTGKVQETVDAGGYTYARVENGGVTVWAAARQTSLPVGTEIRFSTAMPMKDWHSESLDRTWDTVYFTGAFEVAGQGGTSADSHAGMDMSKAPAMSGTAQKVPAGSIEKVEGGVTVADAWTKRAEYAGKEVSIRGQVMKFNGGIMGRNWIHLQDGTGDGTAATNDLTVTTDAVCKVGDTVTVTGKLVTDQDFGSGYTYAVMIEGAKVVVEETSAGTH